MTKLILASFVATVCWFTTAHADIVSTTLDCASEGDAYTECDAGMAFTDAKLVSETVAGNCVYGSTWGTYQHSVWVNHGCSGRFTVSIDKSNGNTPAPAPIPNPPIYQMVDCRFNSVNWQPFNKLRGHFVGRDGFGFADANQCVQTVQLARRNGVCNWVGNGFTPYDIDSNVELVFAAYPTVESCYSAIP